MAFSSIDDPSTTVTGADNSVEVGELVITAMYKQIFGNTYVMESERAELAVFESQFKLDKINVQQLAIAFAKSDLYKRRFFERCGPYGFVELNCKHFLGRAPYGQEEVSEHVRRLAEEGYDAEIESYFTSGEFGMSEVPRFVFKGEYKQNDDFNRMCYLRRYWDGCSTSTGSGSTLPTKAIKAQLIVPPDAHIGNPVEISKGVLKDHYYPPLPRMESGYTIPKNAYSGNKIRIQVAQNSYIVYETAPYQTKDLVPAWKKERDAADDSKKFNGTWY